MSDFHDDDVIGQVRDVCDAYMLVGSPLADRFRYEEVCMSCGTDVADPIADGEQVVVDGLGRGSACYCEGCFNDWAKYEEEFIPLFKPATEYNRWSDDCEDCDYCYGILYAKSYGEEYEHMWYAYDEDGNVACHDCWYDWAWSQDDDSEEDGAWCAECWTALDGWPHVADGDGAAYCMECWGWEGESTREPPAKAPRSDDSAGRARNERDKAKLRARYKDHCAYHLFHAHHRKHKGCTFAADGQTRCSRGSHGVPDDFENAQEELETPARA